MEINECPVLINIKANEFAEATKVKHHSSKSVKLTVRYQTIKDCTHTSMCVHIHVDSLWVESCISICFILQWEILVLLFSNADIPNLLGYMLPLLHSYMNPCPSAYIKICVNVYAYAHTHMQTIIKY